MIRYWRAILTCVWAVIAGLVYWHGFNHWFKPDTAPETALDAVGAVLLGLGCALRLWASVHIRPRKKTGLATSGPYVYCRHPLYLGSILIIVGICLIAQSTLFDVGTLLLWLPAYAIKFRMEEADLRRKYGQAWDDYRAHTPALLPLGRNKGPSSVPPTPLVWTDAFAELPGVLGFILIGVAFELLEDYL